MRTIFALTVFWNLLSLALASPLAAPSGNKPGVKYLDIATPERVAKAKEMVRKKYQEDAERVALGLPAKTMDFTKPRNWSKDLVNCGKPQVDKKMFDTAHGIFRQWCDSDDGQVLPFHHQFMDFGDVRIALCNWGLTNPCRSKELDAAWEALGLVCPDEGSEAAGDATVSTGMWYRGSWLKGYFRSNCTTGDLCNGDRTGIACMNDGRVFVE